MRLFELSQPVEAYGYAYNNRDQRVMWRKNFASAEAAYAWAEKKNATVLGTRNLNESSEESCPACGSADVKTYSDGEKECNHCHHTWNVQGLHEFAPDGFNGGDDGEEFSPEMAKMAYDEGVVKGASLADGATTQRAMAINDWDKHDGGIYSQHFAKGFIAGRKDKIRHNNKQYNLNLKLMKDGSIRHGEQGVAEAAGLYGPFTVTINTGERPQSRTKTKKFRREDDAILWAEDWLEDFSQYSFATAQVTDPDGNVVWTTDEQGVAEGLGKSIKRAAQGWGVGGELDMPTAGGVVASASKLRGDADDRTVPSLPGAVLGFREHPPKNKAQEFAKRVHDREMRQRGYGRFVDKDEQGVAESKSLSKRVRVVKGPDSGKTGWIREIKHGAFKGAPKTYYVDLDDGGQANNLPSAALRLVKEQSVSEMDKSQTPPGRGVGEQGGKEYTAKMTTADKMMKHAHDAMMKAMSDADKVKKGWRNPNIRGNYDDEAKPIRDDGNEGRPGKQRYPGKK